jgi:hypothetical protein
VGGFSGAFFGVDTSDTYFTSTTTTSLLMGEGGLEIAPGLQNFRLDGGMVWMSGKYSSLRESTGLTTVNVPTEDKQSSWSNFGPYAGTRAGLCINHVQRPDSTDGKCSGWIFAGYHALFPGRGMTTTTSRLSIDLDVGFLTVRTSALIGIEPSSAFPHTGTLPGWGILFSMGYGFGRDF